jgi:hypothetical protein
MYVRMNLKGITILAICALAAVPAGALEERAILVPGSAAVASGAEAETAGQGKAALPRSVGDWHTEGIVLRKGFKGGMDFVLADESYKPDPETDLLLDLDTAAVADETGNWAVQAGPAFGIDRSKPSLGQGAGSFRGPDSALALSPGPRSMFGNPKSPGASGFRDFSIEFWLYPANADNGEVVLLWRSLLKLPSGVLPQQLSCVVSGGRLSWAFDGFFTRPLGAEQPGAAKPGQAGSRVELKARSPLVPRVWSHHLLRFDGDTGLVEYLVDGRPEATAYATASGREGGTVFEPTLGSAAPLQFCPDYAGLADELRISRRFVEDPALRPYGRDSSLVVSPIVDLGFGNSRLMAVDSEFKAPGTAGVEFAYRIADSWAGWSLDNPAWIPVRAGETLPESARGRYAQVKAELYADGTGRLGSSISSITLRYVPDPPPPPPARLLATPKDGSVELRWTKVPEADLAGYLVYYGERPGEYFGTGADQGPSPVDAGNTTSLTLTGVPNGRLVYFVVAAYDAAPDPDAGLSLAPASAGVTGAALGVKRAEARAGEFSPEAAARPSRTAK